MRLNPRSLSLRECDTDLHRLTLAFTTLREPSRQAFSETFWGEAKTSFDLAIGDRKGIVKFGRVSEVAHAELIQPFERAELRLAPNDHVYVEFLCVHGLQVASVNPAALTYGDGQMQ